LRPKSVAVCNSEDLKDGFSWRGVTVVNPFAAMRHPLLGALLGETGTKKP
jgi:hypothetical protein